MNVLKKWFRMEPQRHIVWGQTTELRLAGKTIWTGQMDLDLPPNSMVPDMLTRAASELWPCGQIQLRSVHGRTHPNDFSGEPTIIGRPDTWRMIVDVVKY